jgi:multicomponent Na+:H+ antiporter subunit D
VVAFGIKAALFPLFFWLPASYHTPPIAIAAIFAGMLTKVGVYALMRVFTLLFISDIALTHTILFWIALFTMVTGVLGAAAQSDIRRILSFHIISQVGYMILGLSLMTPLSLLGGIFYLTYHIVTKGNLFLIAGIVRWTAGSFELDRVGGLYRYRLPLAMLFLISAFTLAGFPPLAGFWAKLLVVRAAIEVQSWMGAGVALGVGFLTIYSMVKIWIGAFWSSAPDDARPLRPGTPWLLYAPVFALTAFLLLLSFWSEPFMNLAAAAAAEMLDPSQYVGAVLGAEAAALVAGRTP